MASECCKDELQAERYRPMMRLLDGEDFEFLRSQAGITSRDLARLRTQRCRIFGGYLRSLREDFNRVSMALKVVITESGHDRPDLARELLRHQAQFVLTMMRVRFQLVLFRWGIGHVEASRLVKLFDGMRFELMTFDPAAA
jgi:hypothetical protein